MRCLILLLPIVLSGCRGPLGVPMVERLGEEEQQYVDEAWRNMLAPPDRLDRTLLLDALVYYQLHHQGVDYLRMTSEKDVAGGLVVMDVRYDRDNPTFDVFEFTFVDAEGNELRRERYTHAEVLERFNYLCMGPTRMDRECGEPVPDEVQRRQAEHNARMEEIRAATQPASF